MKKITSILKVLAVAALLLVSSRIFAQQQVIQNLTVVDSLVISSLSDTSMIGSAIPEPFRQLVVDQFGTVSAIVYDNIFGDPATPDSCSAMFGTRWRSLPGILHPCPLETRVGIGTSTPAQSLDVKGSGIFSGNLGIGTNIPPTQRLQVTGNGVFSGNVGIGTLTPQAKLDVCGEIRTNFVRVLNTPGCDFVFESDYKLPTLREREKFIMENKRLPYIKPAKEMQEEGADVGETMMGMLQNVEELNLYLFELTKKMDYLEAQLLNVKKENEALKQQLVK